MTNKLSSSYGILQPALKHRFRVLFIDAKMNNLLTTLPQQIKNCKLNIKNKTIDVDIIQPEISGIFQTLNDFIKYPNNILLDILDNKANIISTIQLYRCKCTKHSIDFDYAGSDIAAHHLEFSYSYMKESQPED